MEAMANEAFVKFKEIVERSQTFAVSAGETLDTQKILSAAILNSALKKMGKAASFAPEHITESIKKTVSVILGEEIGGNAYRKENIVIKFDAKTLPAKELKYEKEGDLVKIILESDRPGLDVSNIRIEKESVPVDLFLLIDPKESEIDNILAKTPHKEVIRIGTRDKNLPLKLAGIVRALFGSIPESLRPALWFLIEEEEKTNPSPSKENFEVLKEILDLGFDHKKIWDAKEAISASPFNKLLGRALTRSHYEKEISTFWSFLPRSDFQKTGEGEGALINVLQKLRFLNPQSKFYALLWDSEKTGISGFLASADREKLLQLSGLFATSPASSYFSINSFGSFSEAEIKVRGMIAQIIKSRGAQ